jgi:hypothetical protein
MVLRNSGESKVEFYPRPRKRLILKTRVNYMKQNSDLTEFSYLEHSSILPVPTYSEIKDNEFFYVQVAR